jgi:hypothetical protein
LYTFREDKEEDAQTETEWYAKNKFHKFRTVGDVYRHNGYNYSYVYSQSGYMDSLVPDRPIESEYIDADSVIGEIHMHNNLDSGKGYIFRKYQDKLKYPRIAGGASPNNAVASDSSISIVNGGAIVIPLGHIIQKPRDYTSNIQYFIVALSDSGFFFPSWNREKMTFDAVLSRGLGIARPMELPFYMKTRNYRVTLEKVFDSTISYGTTTWGIK